MTKCIQIFLPYEQLLYIIPTLVADVKEKQVLFDRYKYYCLSQNDKREVLYIHYLADYCKKSLICLKKHLSLCPGNQLHYFKGQKFEK